MLVSFNFSDICPELHSFGARVVRGNSLRVVFNDLYRINKKTQEAIDSVIGHPNFKEILEGMKIETVYIYKLFDKLAWEILRIKELPNLPTNFPRNFLIIYDLRNGDIKGVGAEYYEIRGLFVALPEQYSEIIIRKRNSLHSNFSFMDGSYQYGNMFVPWIDKPESEMDFEDSVEQNVLLKNILYSSRIAGLSLNAPIWWIVGGGAYEGIAKYMRELKIILKKQGLLAGDIVLFAHELAHHFYAHLGKDIKLVNKHLDTWHKGLLEGMDNDYNETFANLLEFFVQQFFYKRDTFLCDLSKEEFIFADVELFINLFPNLEPIRPANFDPSVKSDMSVPKTYFDWVKTVLR
jgi:hypothetical protein